MLNLQEVPGRSWWDCAKPPLCHIGANPLTTSYFIHHRRQFVQQCRGINPGFSDGGRYFLLRASFTFPQLFTSQVLWGGEAKKGKWHASASAIIKEAERSGLFRLFLFLRIPLSFHTRTTVSVIIRDTVLGKWKLWRIWSKERWKRLKKEQAASVGLWGFCQVT